MNDAITGGKGVPPEIARKRHQECNSILGMLAALGGCDPTVIDPDVQGQINEEVLDAMVLMGFDKDHNTSLLVARHGDALAKYYLGLQKSDAAARQHLGLPAKELENVPPAPNTAILDLHSKFDALSAEIRKTKLSSSIKSVQASKAPSFKAAADLYIKNLQETHGSDHRELQFLEHRKAIFLAIMGNIAVDRIGKRELQQLVNEIAYISPNFSRQTDYDVTKVLEHIQDNRAAGGRGLSSATIKDAYLSRVKTIIKFGLEDVGLPYTLTSTRVLIPKRAAAPKKTRAVEPSSFNRALEFAVNDGQHNDALLLALGRLSGRRLSSLVYLRCEDFKQINSHWCFEPESHSFNNGKWIRNPLKTDTSSDECVLQQIFIDIGLVDWVKCNKGYLFKQYHRGIKNPSNAVQKRMDRLLEKASCKVQITRRGKYGPNSKEIIREKEFKFHALRHTRINDYRQGNIDERIRRLQVGHSLTDVHHKYGDLQPAEMQILRDFPISEGINWNVISNLNFSKL